MQGGYFHYDDCFFGVLTAEPSFITCLWCFSRRFDQLLHIYIWLGQVACQCVEIYIFNDVMKVFCHFTLDWDLSSRFPIYTNWRVSMILVTFFLYLSHFKATELLQTSCWPHCCFSICGLDQLIYFLSWLSFPLIIFSLTPLNQHIYKT